MVCILEWDASKTHKQAMLFEQFKILFKQKHVVAKEKLHIQADNN